MECGSCKFFGTYECVHAGEYNEPDADYDACEPMLLVEQLRDAHIQSIENKNIKLVELEARIAGQLKTFRELAEQNRGLAKELTEARAAIHHLCDQSKPGCDACMPSEEES